MKEEPCEPTGREPCDITRRHALKVAIRGGVVLICALAARGAAAAPRWVRAGAVTDFRTGEPRKVTLAGGQVIYVLRKREGGWLALSALCTHKGAIVEWQRSRNRFFCPLHDATFGPTGKNQTDPAPRPLAVFPVKASGREVLLDTSGAALGANKPAGRTGKAQGKSRERHDEHDEHEEYKKRRKHEDDDD